MSRCLLCAAGCGVDLRFIPSLACGWQMSDRGRVPSSLIPLRWSLFPWRVRRPASAKDLLESRLEEALSELRGPPRSPCLRRPYRTTWRCSRNGFTGPRRGPQGRWSLLERMGRWLASRCCAPFPGWPRGLIAPIRKSWPSLRSNGTLVQESRNPGTGTRRLPATLGAIEG